MTKIGFLSRYPSFLVSPQTVIQTIKESKFYTAPTEWQSAYIAYEWAHSIKSCHTMLVEGINFLTNTTQDPTDLDEKILLTDKCQVPDFESIVVYSQTRNTMMKGHHLNIITQMPYPDDKAELPNRLYLHRTKGWQLQCHCHPHILYCPIYPVDQRLCNRVGSSGKCSP